MRKFFNQALSGALFLILATTSAIASENIGQIKTLTGDLLIERNGDNFGAELGDRVYQSDVLKTGNDSATGILFSDDSRMALGPNSEFALTKYEFDNVNGKGQAELDIRSGSLAVIAGKMIDRQPESLKVRTPTAILAVRGTEFAVHVGQPVENK